MHKEGRGLGRLANYKPWLEVTHISSLGRGRRVPSPKTGRTHQLLSDVEYSVFLALEWSRDVVDIREQYPLDRAATQAVAMQLGIQHPHYPGTHIPTVMTCDFMVTRMRDGAEVHEFFDAKTTVDAEDTRSMLKLEITRSLCKQLGVKHHVVFDTLIPAAKVKNIDCIRGAFPKEGETEPRPGYWSGLTARMATDLSSANYSKKGSLAEYCSDFDARHGIEQGSGIRTALMLMAERMIKVDLAAESVLETPMANLVITARPGQLRSLGFN